MADQGAAGLGAAGAGAAAPAAGAGAANNAPAAGTGSQIAIKVAFELDTMDGLRKVIFGLEMDTKGTDKIWTIHFQLQERATNTPATTPFINVVTLDVTVDDEALHPAAAAAANNGLTPPQASHALGAAADDAKNSTTPEDDPDHVDTEDAKGTVANTLAAK